MTQKTEIPNTPTAPRKPDGTITTRIKNQTVIVELFFNHGSTETFGDRLLRAIHSSSVHSIPQNRKERFTDGTDEN